MFYLHIVQVASSPIYIKEQNWHKTIVWGGDTQNLPKVASHVHHDDWIAARTINTTQINKVVNCKCQENLNSSYCAPDELTIDVQWWNAWIWKFRQAVIFKLAALLNNCVDLSWHFANISCPNTFNVEFAWEMRVCEHVLITWASRSNKHHGIK